MDLQELLQKYQLNPNKFYPTSKLWEIMLDLGLTNHSRLGFTTGWISRKVDRGELILPNKGKYDRHKFTGTQIASIVAAFVPGGVGKWDYREESTFSQKVG